MAEVKTEPVVAQIVEDIVRAPAGAIKFYADSKHDPAGFHFKCPCGCGAVGGVRFFGEVAWSWNNSLDKPSVHPSVLLTTGDRHWHGHLTDGVWKSCT